MVESFTLHPTFILLLFKKRKRKEVKFNVNFNSDNCDNYILHIALYGVMRERERNVLFNDALNTFYLRLYGVRHMVKDHSDSEKGNPLPPHRVLLYAPSHRQDNTYHGLCYTSRGALAGTRNSSMGPPHEGSIRRPTAPWANAPGVITFGILTILFVCLFICLLLFCFV